MEGPTDDPAVTALRERMLRNFLATLFLSQGVPMLLAGDEIGRTQQGNNNAYCQDNELSWVNWTLSRAAKEQLEFTRRLIRLRLAHPGLPPAALLPGPPHRGLGGQGPLLVPARRQGDDRGGVDERLHALPRASGSPATRSRKWTRRGARSGTTRSCSCSNAHHEPLDFVLPAHRTRVRWELVLDTRDWAPRPRALRAGDQYPLEARSLALLRLRSPQGTP